MNSLDVLVAHTAGAEPYWIGAVVGQRPSDRDREAEGRAARLDAAALLQRLAESKTCAHEVLDALTLADLEAPRPTTVRLAIPDLLWYNTGAGPWTGSGRRGV